MGNPLTKAVGNILTMLMGNVLTEPMGKVLDIYSIWSGLPRESSTGPRATVLIKCKSQVLLHTGKVVAKVLERKPHPEQGYRACLGIIRLEKQYTQERVEAACKRAFMFKAFSYKSVKLNLVLTFRPL